MSQNAGQSGGRRLKLLHNHAFDGSMRFRSNNQAFSASLSVSPSYIAKLASKDSGEFDEGLATAVAYAVDVRPENWFAYATGSDVDENLVRLLAGGPVAYTDAALNRRLSSNCYSAFVQFCYLFSVENGELSGDAYAKARGNFVAFSRAYVHLMEEAALEGIDIKARSQARATAVSEKYEDDIALRRLYNRFVDDYESEAKVLAIVDADVDTDGATAKQEATAETDDNEEGRHCARVWLKGEAVEGIDLSEDYILARGWDLDAFKC